MKKIAKNIAGNIWKLYVGSFLYEVFFFAAVMIPILGGLGFSVQQVLMMEASFSVALVLFEIPSGYFADLYGRRTSIILAAILVFSGMVIFACSELFIHFVFAEIVLAAGISFSSGAKEALLYDSLLEMGEESRYRKIQGNMFFNMRISGTVANLISGFLVVIMLRLPFYLSILPALVWIPFAFSLFEPSRYDVSAGSLSGYPLTKGKRFKQILFDTWKTPKLRWFIFYGAFPGAFLLMAFWFYQSYMEFIELPVFYFGIVVAGLSIVSGLFSKYADEIEKLLSPRISLVLIPYLLALSWCAMAFLKSPLGIALICFVGGIWGFSAVIFRDFVQKIVSSDRRATVLSIQSMASRSIFFIFSPFLGAVVDLYDVRYALFLSAFMILIFGSLGLFMLRKSGVI